MGAIEYNNRQLTERLIPSYHRMVKIFRENYCLADQETRKYFPELLKFVNLWDRWFENSIPSEVAEYLDHGEEHLYSLYEDLERKHDELRKKLVDGQA